MTESVWLPASRTVPAIGWEPDGLVYGTYEVSGATAVVFTCQAQSDIDGDQDFDLVVQDQTGLLTTYRNSGTATSYQFEWIANPFGDIQLGPVYL